MDANVVVLLVSLVGQLERPRGVLGTLLRDAQPVLGQVSEEAGVIAELEPTDLTRDGEADQALPSREVVDLQLAAGLGTLFVRTRLADDNHDLLVGREVQGVYLAEGRLDRELFEVGVFAS